MDLVISNFKHYLHNSCNSLAIWNCTHCLSCSKYKQSSSSDVLPHNPAKTIYLYITGLNTYEMVAKTLKIYYLVKKISKWEVCSRYG